MTIMPVQQLSHNSLKGKLNLPAKRTRIHTGKKHLLKVQLFTQNYSRFQINFWWRDCSSSNSLVERLVSLSYTNIFLKPRPGDRLQKVQQISVVEMSKEQLKEAAAETMFSQTVMNG